MSFIPITPVPPARPHSFPEESFSFCCRFIPPAFIHLKSPPGPAALCLLCQPGIYAPEGSPQWREDNSTASHANTLFSAYAYLMPLWALAYICSICLLHVTAIFMIPRLALSTSHTLESVAEYMGLVSATCLP